LALGYIHISLFRMTVFTRYASLLVLSMLSVTHPARAQDAFAAVKCGSDVPRLLIGKKSPSGPVAATELKHRDIGLKDEGASEISDTLTYTSWRICGHEYAVVLDRRNIMRDVIPFPAHSRQTPGFFGSCKRAGKPVPEVVLAVLSNPSSLPANRHYAFGDSATLRATTAWKVDERRSRFVVLSTSRLDCPRNAIFTVDGGP
jgi:hypothetical protein